MEEHLKTFIHEAHRLPGGWSSPHLPFSNYQSQQPPHIPDLTDIPDTLDREFQLFSTWAKNADHSEVYILPPTLGQSSFFRSLIPGGIALPPAPLLVQHYLLTSSREVDRVLAKLEEAWRDRYKYPWIGVVGSHGRYAMMKDWLLELRDGCFVPIDMEGSEGNRGENPKDLESFRRALRHQVERYRELVEEFEERMEIEEDNGGDKVINDGNFDALPFIIIPASPVLPPNTTVSFLRRLFSLPSFLGRSEEQRGQREVDRIGEKVPELPKQINFSLLQLRNEAGGVGGRAGTSGHPPSDGASYTDETYHLLHSECYARAVALSEKYFGDVGNLPPFHCSHFSSSSASRPRSWWAALGVVSSGDRDRKRGRGGGGGEREGVGERAGDRFRAYAARVVKEDFADEDGWETALRHPVLRKWVVVGILGKVLEGEVWVGNRNSEGGGEERKKEGRVLLFGGEEGEDEISEVLRVQDEKSWDVNAYDRKHTRASHIRGYLGRDRLLPGAFWLQVDRLTAQTAALLKPLSDLLAPYRSEQQLEEHKQQGGEGSSFYQDLHSLIAFAGYLQVCTAVCGDSNFQFRSAIPGSRMDFDEGEDGREVQADKRVYRVSKRRNREMDRLWTERLSKDEQGREMWRKRLEEQGQGHVVHLPLTPVGRQREAGAGLVSGMRMAFTPARVESLMRRYPLAKDGEEDKTIARCPRVKIAVFPGLTRYQRCFQIPQQHRGNPRQVPLGHRFGRFDEDDEEGQRISVVVPVTVVHYQGLTHPASVGGDGMPLSQHLEDMDSRMSRFQRWVFAALRSRLMWLALLSLVTWPLWQPWFFVAYEKTSWILEAPYLPYLGWSMLALSVCLDLKFCLIGGKRPWIVCLLSAMCFGTAVFWIVRYSICPANVMVTDLDAEWGP